MYIQVNLKDILIPARPESTELRHGRSSSAGTERQRRSRAISAGSVALSLSSLICQKGLDGPCLVGCGEAETIYLSYLT